MNESLIAYIKDVLHLRGQLSTISHVKKESEIMKVWARWIITHRSLCPQGNLILPDDEEYDPQLIVELQEKGETSVHAEFLHDLLITECRRVNKNYSQIATMESGGVHGSVPISINVGNRNVTLGVGAGSELTVSIPVGVHTRMSRNYQGIALYKNNYIWLCATMYDILDGKGLQWAVPSDVMNILRSSLGCYTELFASPLNAYNKHYYSLFPLDKLFGSRGNFFTAPDSDFISGTYQINPPFIDQLFTKTSERVLELLERAERADQELTFIYIMPEWKDFITYNMIAESRFCVKRIYLRSGQHYYYQYSTGCYIPTRFSSYMFFLSTNSKICSNTLESNIRYAFQGR